MFLMIVQSFIKLFVFLWAHARLLLTLLVCLTIMIGLLPVATLWLSKEMINEVAKIIQLQVGDYRYAFFLLSLQFLIAMATSVLLNIQQYLNGKLENVLEIAAQSLVLQKVEAVPLFYFDIPDFYNHLERVHLNVGARFLSPFTILLEIVRASITIFSFLLFLLTVHWSLVILSLIAAIPVFFVQIRFGSINYWLRYGLTPLIRDIQYTSFLLKDRQSAKEIRLFGLGQTLLKRWSTSITHQFTETLKVLRKQQATEVGLDGFTALLYFGTAGIIIWLIRTTSMQIGEFVAIGQAVQGTQGLTNQLSNQLAKIFGEILYINDFFQFIEYEHPEKDASDEGSALFPAPLQQGIFIKGLSFTYVNTTNPVLRDIHLHIRPGEKIAIVGENGSGKSTLVKCVMGLYPISQGDISFDGLSISQIKPDDLRKNMTVIFQDFIKYAYTLQDNIGFGDTERMNDLKWMQEIAATAGVDQIVSKLPDGYQTYLSRYLQEGTDLSGGQWQKIALARALFRNSDIVILDEPTAALDPMTELSVYQLVRKLTENKTTLFVSHRMAAAKMADRIIVMKDGQLVESGTHDELISRNKEYAQMYHAQAQWYATPVESR
ncbi:ABC transporter ATP-binding protein [Brevibacillus brevis]|nr:ABC transporter ATP-binding protein [Lysinibacillus sp. SDF0063]